jgi:thiol-disulfide isomerase/thioredoxin
MQKRPLRLARRLWYPRRMRWKATRSLRWVSLALGLASQGCARTAAHAGSASNAPGAEESIALCDHRVPADVCSRHHPELVARFKRVGDWCPEHEVPESQCLACHPDLSFRPLPALPEAADVAWLSREGEDVPDLAAHAVKGKVTIFEFYADWCAVCRKVDDHLFGRMLRGDGSFAFRKLNVVAWESPLGERYLKGVPSLPLIVVFDRAGKRLRALYGFDARLLDTAIADASR